MCLVHDPDCDCERHVLSSYRKHRENGRGYSTAYVCALLEFQNLHPEAGALAAMGAVKNAISAELDAGIVDSGELAVR